MGSIEAGETLRFGTLEVRPLNTPGHTAGMLSFLVGERSGPPELRVRPGGRHERRARRLQRRRGRRVHRRHAVQGLRRRRQSARPHHLHRPARLDHGHADGAAARDRHLPGPLRRDDGRRGVGRQQPSSASGAAWTPRARSRASRSASRPRSCCSARTTTAAPRPGCAGRTAPTTSCPARASSERLARRDRAAARGS